MTIKLINGIAIEADTLDGAQLATITAAIATAVSDEATARGEAIGDHAGLPNVHHTPTTRLMSKVKEEERVMTAASGDVSYTGYGFTPTALSVIAECADIRTCFGHSDQARTNYVVFYRQANLWLGTTGLIEISGIPSSTDYQLANVNSYDVDGYTLTWGKTGSPTGTATLSILALR